MIGEEAEVPPTPTQFEGSPVQLAHAEKQST
jgi:hypothetical protein